MTAESLPGTQVRKGADKIDDTLMQLTGRDSPLASWEVMVESLFPFKAHFGPGFRSVASLIRGIRSSSRFG